MDERWYTIIGSRILLPDSEYCCLVTLSSDSIKPTTVTIEIDGDLDSGTKFSASQTAEMKPYVTSMIKFQIGNTGPGAYTLKARGEGGMEFTSSTILDFQCIVIPKVFIQTDRPVYKPGSKVQFRILILDQNVKPVDNSSPQVIISDGCKNKVKEWHEVITLKGVWSGELQLSECPVFGNWSIQVLLLDQTFTKEFEVAEYVLPKFGVSLDTPQRVLLRHATIPVSISAKYTYGGAVKGEVTVKATVSCYDNTVSKAVPINGETVIYFSMDELGFKSLNEMVTINFKATVEESLTGKKQIAKGSTYLSRTFYQLDLKYPHYFKPGLEFVGYLKVLQYDGTPVTDSTKPVVVDTNYGCTSELDIEENGINYEIPKSGLVKLTLLPPKDAEFLCCKVSYEGFDTLSMHLGHDSRSRDFIRANITTLHLQVNSDIEVEVDMTEHSPVIFYLVHARKSVILGGEVPVEEGKTSASFKFLATPAMALDAKLVVYYIRKDLEMIADTVVIGLDCSLPNFATLKIDVSEFEPGQDIELKVESKPNSYVGLLGVDQSVFLLKKEHNISKDEVLHTLGINCSKLYPERFLDFASAYGIFELNAPFVFTNAFMHEAIDEICVAYSIDSENKEMTSESKTTFLPKYLPNKMTIRSNFPETWIWQGVDTNEEGKASINLTIPDSITSWVVSAFSLDSTYGLGLIDQPTKIKVFRPFFLSLDLPYSIIRGETVTIPVALFNYMDTDVTADVTLLNLAGQFEFGDDTNSLMEKPENVHFKKERVTVKPNSGERTSFTITATELGYISIRVTAKSDIIGDAVEQKLLVKAEGETQYLNKAVLLNLREVNSTEESIPVNIPEGFVPGSAHVEVSTIGNILGTCLQNLNELIRIPCGCAEQNILTFVPNVIALEYLKNSGQLTPFLENKCLNYMNLGYQRELTYIHPDGSFSTFGSFDRSGSTWLTALVLKSFARAEPYMLIDSDVIEMGLDWLAQRQDSNGNFSEPGMVPFKDICGDFGESLVLTSFTLLPFLAYNKPEHTSTIEKGLKYIMNQLDNVKNDNYSLAISTYVLHVARHPAKDSAFQLLQSNSTTTGSMKRWKRVEKQSDLENPFLMCSNSVDIEMTAYAMLTYLERDLVEDTFPILNWLISQQNSYGGFSSSQDSLVALSALFKLVEKTAVNEEAVTVTFSTDDGFKKDLSINCDNYLTLQKLEIPGVVKKVNVKAKGKGLAIAQVSYLYNLDMAEARPMFNIQPEVKKSSNLNQFLLDICTSFITGVDGDKSTNMVVMEVILPSGYSVDQDCIQDLQSSQSVKRVELTESDTHVVLYFDEMTKKKLYLSITAVKTHKVEKPKAVPITVYDYYDQSRHARVFYAPPFA